MVITQLSALHLISSPTLEVFFASKAKLIINPSIHLIPFTLKAPLGAGFPRISMDEGVVAKQCEDLPVGGVHFEY